MVGGWGGRCWQYYRSLAWLARVDYRPHSFSNPDLYFDQMSRTEKKRAELSISEKSLRMDAKEIEVARALTDVTFNWLSGKSEAPRLSQPVPIGKVHLSFECGPPILDSIERFADLELVSSFMIGAAYLQGQPRRPVTRSSPAALAEIGGVVSRRAVQKPKSRVYGLACEA
ncbi:MAG: hypothetical protein WA397_26305 [Roseiarcus sp.]